MASSTSRPRARQLTIPQLVALLVTFLLLAGVGGLLTAGLFLPMAAGASAVTKSSAQIFEELPTELEPGELSQASRIYAANGKLLATFFVENRTVVPLDEISMAMQNAVIAIEDKRFFAHGGVDLEGIGRALLVNIVAGRNQGASTLTQQYVKNVLIEDANRRGDRLGVAAARAPEPDRKLREAKLAIALEKRMNKLEILERYLNIAQFGVSVYGVESAANYYFNKPASKLSVAEAATIAGITKAPTKYDPVLNPDNAEMRRNIVLGEMYSQGYITKAELDKARATKLKKSLKVTPVKRNCEAAGGAAYFCDYVTKVILSDPVFGETPEERADLLNRGGLDIHTTIDLKLQKAANKELRATIPEKDPTGIANAMTTVEPGTGKILVMAQNRKYVADPLAVKPGSTTVNYSADQAHGGSRGFPAGSTFKTFVLTEWLLEGHNLDQKVDASSTAWPGNSWTASCIPDFNAGRGEYRPRNSDGAGSGMRSVLQATAFSINTAYVAMENQLDLCGVADTAYQVGFRPSLSGTPDGPANEEGVQIVPSMVLGVQNTSPLAQAAAYATFAAGGKYCDPIAITSIKDSTGKDLPLPQANCRTVVDQETATAVTHALQQVLTNGGAKSAQLAGGRPAAGKTGTAQMNYHTWFIGYTPQLSTAVWIGHPDRNVPMQRIQINGRWHSYVYGSTLAAPTWKRFMDTALQGKDKKPFGKVDDKLLKGEKVAVPRVSGMDQSTAQQVLEDAGFKSRVHPQRINSGYPAGVVVYSSPSGIATSGNLITLHISNGVPRPTPAPGPNDGDDDDSKPNKDRKPDKSKRDRGKDRRNSDDD